jgi:hypothetical protein
VINNLEISLSLAYFLHNRLCKANIFCDKLFWSYPITCEILFRKCTQNLSGTFRKWWVMWIKKRPQIEESFFNFDVTGTGKCRDPTLWWCWQTPKVMSKNTECVISIQHIIRWRSHHPQWPWWTFQHAGYCPSSSWSRRTNPNIWEDDTTLTAYLPPSGCRIVQRNRCPPNHPVVGWLTVSRIRESTLWQRCPATDCLNPWRCIIPRWWTNEPTKATFALTHDPLQQQSSSSGESLQSQTAYVHAIMTPYDSCRRVLWQLLI